MLNSFLEVSRMLILFIFLKGGQAGLFWIVFVLDSGFFFFFFEKVYNLGKSKRKAKYPYAYHFDSPFFFKKNLISFIEV